MASAMSHGFKHPLDVDLADLAEDLLDPSRREAVEDHLSGCLLCRIKLRRLREALDERSGPSLTSTAADAGELRLSVPPVLAAGIDAEHPAPGQLWVTSGQERLIVIVARVTEGRAFVAPVTFDVLAADEDTVVVDAILSPLGMSVALYPDLAVELPTPLLAACFGTLVEPADVAQLLAGTLSGTRRGEPIEGPTDPRLEFRQLLADHVGAQEEIRPDPDTAADAPPPRPESVASALAVELRRRRGEACKVRRLGSWEELLLAYSKGWTALASVDEEGTVLVVFDTPTGLAASDDFNTALAVLTRFNATAVVVLATSLSRYVDVFDAPSLSYGIGVPSGGVSPPAPLLSGLALADAIVKFLDKHSAWSESPWSERASTTPADVSMTLSGEAHSAIEEIVRQGSRAQIAPKIAGYTSIATLGGDVAGLLQRALGGEPLAQHLLDLAERNKP
jgi:hypothetical protein